jgi:RES domain-containing protein
MRIVVMILFLFIQNNVETSVKNSNSTSFSWSLIVSGIILLGLIIAVILLLKSKAKLDTRIARRDKEIVDLKETIKAQKYELATKNRALSDTKSMIADNENELVIEELTKDLEIAKATISELMVNLKPANNIEGNAEEDKPVEENSDVSSNSYYGKCLVENEVGFLIPSKISNHQTPYIIEERNEKFVFKLDLNNSSALGNAINFYDVYIKDFCDPENAYLNTHESFHAVDNGFGILEKEGNKFRVLEKIKIKFI